jgi:SHAQKYF class myb-like DNA-binding protein
MHPGVDRPPWQQSAAYPDRSQQTQTGWFPLQQETQQQQQQQPPMAGQEEQQSPRSWGQDAHTPSSNSQVYTSSPMYSSAYVWTGEAHAQQSLQAQFMPSPTYPRPLESELYAQEVQQHEQKPAQQTLLRRNKQIAIGRWNNEEHQWFLKGLEMFQGPAWGEIARLIGTRTSTQVRTHAQKFFTKLARLNQTMPYFEVQIRKERARLVAQGASVTPTAQSGPNATAAATLSPRKRLASAGNSPRQTLKRFKEEATTSPTYAAAVQQTRYPQEVHDTKPRVYTGAAMAYPSASLSGGASMTKEWAQQWTSEDARQWPQVSPTSATASLQLTQMQMGDAQDVDSLPSMDKLLYRGTAA